MRVLISSTAGLGHVHPMVPLARALREAGHEILWASGPATAAHLRNSGFEAVESGLDAEVRSGLYRRQYPEAALLPAADRPTHMLTKLFGEIGVREMLTGLLAAARDWEPSLLIHDPADFAGPLAAAIAGIPHVTHSYGGLVPPRTVEKAAVELAPLWLSHGLEPRPYAGCYDHLYIDIYPPSMQSADIELIPHRQLARPVAFAGEGELGNISEFVNGDERPLLYMTFGTRFSVNRTFHLALEALRDLDIQVLVTVGPDGDPASLGPQPSNVRIERYVPQTLILDHCQVVVSHGGSGTLLAALARGIPQLCLPQGADQFRNAASCERVGAGIQLQEDQVDGAAIKDAIRRLLTDSSFRVGAQKVEAEIRTMPAPAEVAVVLEELVSATA